MNVHAYRAEGIIKIGYIENEDVDSGRDGPWELSMPYGALICEEHIAGSDDNEYFVYRVEKMCVPSEDGPEGMLAAMGNLARAHAEADAAALELENNLAGAGIT